jgi:hypothetical protein
MSKPDDGGQAFPSLDVFTNRYGEVCSQQLDGMTLRDYFAAQAITGLLARNWADLSKDKPDYMHKLWATAAYDMADAMLAARSKP